MKVWIPGANGLLGSALIKAAPSSLGTSRKEVDIADLHSLRSFARRNPGITHIVNCAAFSAVDLSETRSEEAYLANAIGPENLAILAMEIKAHLIHISTDYVFPGCLQRPLREQDNVAPLNYYGKTKLEGEQRVEWAMPSACILRVSFLFGQGGKNFVGKLLPLLQEEKEISLTNDQWGRPTYVPDLVQVIFKMLDRSGIYHFANSGATTKYEFAIAMREECASLGIPVSASIRPVPGSTFASACKRPPYSVFDTSKIEREIQIKPRPWRQCLREFLVEHATAQAPC